MSINGKGPFALSAPGLCLAVVLVAGACGCGSNASNLVKVSGLVTLDGEPLPGAKVTYYPSSGAAPALGVSNDAGRFELTTFDIKTRTSSDGALPGDYKVTVEMPTPTGRNPGSPDDIEAGHMAGKKRGIPAKVPKVIHANYGDVSTTPLKQVVPSAGAVELKLTKGGT